MRLPDHLVSTLRERAADAGRRTDANRLKVGGFMGLISRLLVKSSRPRGRPPGPASEAAIERAEAELGFGLPEELRQLYLEVADGGFGPDRGLYSIRELLAKYQEFTHEPIGERGQKWPKNLLPVSGDEWDVHSIDLKTGAIVYWDVEEIDYGGWKKSFKPEAESLEAWLGKWAEKLPTRKRKPGERRYHASQFTDEDYDRWFADNPEYARRFAVFSMTPEERREMGLPDEGWEAKVWEGYTGGYPKPWVKRKPPSAAE
jgi:hypothetical protein